MPSTRRTHPMSEVGTPSWCRCAPVRRLGGARYDGPPTACDSAGSRALARAGLPESVANDSPSQADQHAVTPTQRELDSPTENGVSRDSGRREPHDGRVGPVHCDTPQSGTYNYFLMSRVR